MDGVMVVATVLAALAGIAGVVIAFLAWQRPRSTESADARWEMPSFGFSFVEGGGCVLALGLVVLAIPIVIAIAVVIAR